MSRLNFSQGQIDALEFQANQAYEALTRAVDSREPLDAQGCNNLYDLLGRSLSRVTHSSQFWGAKSFMVRERGPNWAKLLFWKRDHTKTDLLDRFLLQYAVGNYSSETLERHTLNQKIGTDLHLEDTQIEEGDLVSAIDGKSDYSRLQIMAMELAAAGKIDVAVKALDHIRANYEIPQV